MNLQTFIADSAAEAISQIRDQLGPEAVVLNVRKVPGEGLTRLWRRPRIELVACVPEPAPEAQTDRLEDFRRELDAIRQQLEAKGDAAMECARQQAGAENRWNEPDVADSGALPRPGTAALRGSLLERWLERSGLLPNYAARLADEVHLQAPEGPVLSVPAWARASAPAESSFAGEWARARAILRSWWPAPKPAASNTHLFIGAAGSGKTTVLCKWMAQAVLMENRRARVWRLDGDTANTAENLSVFAEILGVPLERVQPESPAVDPAELLFIDMPGVNWRDKGAVAALAARVNSFAGAHIHLVLNTAYESHLLLAQARAFGALAAGDVVLTHLDEETRWGKVWNVVLGTNFSVSFVSGGQNIPGRFEVADPEKLLDGTLA